MANEKVFRIKIDGITRAYSDIMNLSNALRVIGDKRINIHANFTPRDILQRLQDLIDRTNGLVQANASLSRSFRISNNDTKKQVILFEEAKNTVKAMEGEIANLEAQLNSYTSQAQRSSQQARDLADRIDDLKTKHKELNDLIDEYNFSLKYNGILIRAVSKKCEELSSSIDKGADSISQILNVTKDAVSLTEAFGIQTDFSKKALDGISKSLKIVGALQTLNNSLLAKKGLLSKDGIALDTIRILQMKAANKALALQTKGTAAATVAQKIFNAVAKANPYVLLATAIISVVGALALFASGSKDASERQEKMNELVQQSIVLKNNYMNYLKRQSQEITDQYEREYDLAVAQGASEEELQKKRKKILVERLKAAKDLKKQAKDEIEQIDENKKKYVGLTAKMKEYQKAYADALKNGKEKIRVNIDGKSFKLSVDQIKKDMESLQTGLDITQAKLDMGLNAVKEVKDAENNIAIEDAKNNKKRRDDEEKKWQERTAKRKKQIDEEANLTRKAEDLLTNSISSEYARRSAIIQDNYGRQIEDYKKKLAEDKSLTQKAKDEIYKIIKSLEEEENKKLQELNKEQQEKLKQETLEIAKSLTTAKLAEVKEGSEEELLLKEEMLRLEAEQEAYSATLSIENAELRAAKLKEIEAKLQQDLKKLRKEKTDSDSQKQNENLEKTYNKEVLLLTNQLKNKEIKQREFDQKMLELEITSLKEQIQLRKKAGEDTTDLEIKLSEKSIALSKLVKDSKLKDIEELSEKTENIMNHAGAIFDAASSILGQQLEEAKAKYDEINKEYDEIVKKQEESNNRLQQLQEQASNARGGRGLVLQQQIDAEMAKNQQLAAQEKKLAKEKEKQEKEIAKKEKKQKKLEIAQNIAQAIVNTSLGIMKANAMSPITLGMPWSGIIGATGAVQVGVMARQLAKLEDGGLLKGKRHSQGGMRVEGTNIEVEGGEYVVNRESTNRNLGLIRYINSQRRELQPQDINAFFSKPQQAYEPPFKRMFEQGGQLPAVNNVVNVDNESLIEAIQSIRIEPKVSVTDINAAQDKAVEVSAWSGI